MTSRVLRLAFVWAIPFTASALVPGSAAGMQAPQAARRDTITPHYARWRDELPEKLARMSSVVESGLEESARLRIVSELKEVAPTRPVSRYDVPAIKQYLFKVRYRGHESLLTLFMYWPDTARVALRPRSTDLELVYAIDSVLHAADIAPLVKPANVRISFKDGEGWDGGPSHIGLDLAVDPAPHCPWFGVDNRFEHHGDTLALHIYGVAPTGSCPGYRSIYGNGYSSQTGPGHYVVAVDFRSDTNFFALDVTDSSLVLTPRRTTFVTAIQPVKWRIPSSSFILGCLRAEAQDRLCDALHEWVLGQPGVRRVSFPPDGVSPLGHHFDAERVAVYRYPSEGMLTHVRNCLASIAPQVRKATWVSLKVRAADGRWSVTRSDDSTKRLPETMMDGAGNVRCPQPDVIATAREAPPRAAPLARTPASDTRRPLASDRAPHTTAVAMFAYKQTDPTTLEARSDGWIVITPLQDSPWGPKRYPYPTTRLYARAADALRWVERVRGVLDGMRDTLPSGNVNRFVPSLGLGRVQVNTRFDPSLSHQEGVSLEFADCEAMHRQYNVDRRSLLEIATNVERAARTAVRESPVAVSPTLARPYYASEVSCTAAPSDSNAKPIFPDDLPEAARRYTEVGVRFVVDTAGRVEPGSVTVLPGTTPRFATATRVLLAGWRFRAAEWANAPVRQVINMTLIFNPGPLPPRPTVAAGSPSASGPPVMAVADSDGWVHLLQATWRPGGRLAGYQEWVPPDLVDAWLVRARAFLAADSANPVRPGQRSVPHPELLGYEHGAKLSLSHQSGWSPKDTVLRVQAFMTGCNGGNVGVEPVDAPFLARIEAAARLARARRATPAPIDVRVFAEGETSCPTNASPIGVHQNGFPGTWLYPLHIEAPAGTVRAHTEVLASILIDSTGAADSASLVVMPGSDTAGVAALRAAVSDYRFSVPRRSGRWVRQRTIRAWLVEPAPVCLDENAGPRCPPDDVLSALPIRGPVPPALLEPRSLYDIRAEVAPLDESVVLPEALALPSLKARPLPRGTRELRVYTGLVIGYPHSGLIVRQEGGVNGRVTGRLIRYWPVNDRKHFRNDDDIDLEARYAALEEGRCDPPRRSAKAVACTVRFTREPDWKALLRALDSVNAWGLPDGSKVPSRGMTIDGWRIRAEARRDTSYHQYEYQNPQVYRPPEGPNALRIMWLVDSLFRYSQPPKELRHLRGIYRFGKDTSDFTPCDLPALTGLFQGALGPVRALIGDSAWKAPSTPARAFEVDAWVRRRPNVDRERSTRLYASTWYVDSITAVWENPTRRCER